MVWRQSGELLSVGALLPQRPAVLRPDRVAGSTCPTRIEAQAARIHALIAEQGRSGSGRDPSSTG